LIIGLFTEASNYQKTKKLKKHRKKFQILYTLMQSFVNGSFRSAQNDLFVVEATFSSIKLINPNNCYVNEDTLMPRNMTKSRITLYTIPR
jgi:hypothetical protein